MKNLNEKGFTLVELMVVVAIIGVLSSVAIPNFKKYQAKAKQSEAKLQLAGVFTAESAGYAEYDQYLPCLTALGYAPGTMGYYTVGFVSGAVVGTDVPASCNTGTGESFFPATKASGGAITTAVAGTTTATTFSAEAVGQVSQNGVDTWTMDHNKTIVPGTGI